MKYPGKSEISKKHKIIVLFKIKLEKLKYQVICSFRYLQIFTSALAQVLVLSPINCLYMSHSLFMHLSLSFFLSIPFSFPPSFSIFYFSLSLFLFFSFSFPNIIFFILFPNLEITDPCHKCPRVIETKTPKERSRFRR